MRLTLSASRSLLLLAPPRRRIPARFKRVQSDPVLHEDLLAETQAFRGQVYLDDGAIKPSQLIGGRHNLGVDGDSWHLLLLDANKRVCGCARYTEYPAGTPFTQLGVSLSALATSKEWGGTLSAAVTREVALSAEFGCTLSELGGWALDEQVRGTVEALRMCVAVYALTQELGGAIGLSSVTHRRGSASILRKMGGRPLEFGGTELPSYYDPQYECEMELLRFYSWAPNPRYGVWINDIKAELRDAPVLIPGSLVSDWLRPGTPAPADSLMFSASVS
jgi:hypothetical protein